MQDFFAPFAWETMDNYYFNDGKLEIHAWALDRDSNTSLLRIQNLGTFIRLILPLSVESGSLDWSDVKLQTAAFDAVRNCLREDAPTRFVFEFRKRLYLHSESRKPVLTLYFDTVSAANHCFCYYRKYPLKLFKYNLSLNVSPVENTIDPIRKLLTVIDLNTCQWFSSTIEEPEERVSKDGIREYIVDYRQIKPIAPEETKSWVVHPSAVSFDIECHSTNYRAMPVATLKPNVITIITCVYQRIGKLDTRRQIALVNGKVNKKRLSSAFSSAEVIEFPNELNLIKGLCELINHLNPNMLTGYNIHAFDYDYIDKRLSRCLEAWPNISCLKQLSGPERNFSSFSWSSGAYGKNVIAKPYMPGRISVDMLSVIKRDLKLPKYDLNTVCMEVLKKGKRDVKITEMFASYDRLLDATKKDSESLPEAINDFSKYVDYGLQDADLVIELMEARRFWITMVEMANVTKVPIETLVTKGQQIKCFNQMFDSCHKKGYVIDSAPLLDVKKLGGFVGEPIVGVHDNVICLDFNSLYPSIIMTYNICYTTLIPKERWKLYSEDRYYSVKIDEDGKIVREHRFMKQPEGILPGLVRSLVESRRQITKKEMPPLENATSQEEKLLYSVLNCRQLALKVSANSLYGFLGVKNGGKLPCVEASESVTCIGRTLIKEVNRYVEEELKGKVIYNDTDSSMFTLPGVTNGIEAWVEAKKAEEKINKTFPGVLKMEVEKVMRICCIKKKMYAAKLVDQETGEFTTKPFYKGIILQRREKCKWVQNTYAKVLKCALDRRPLIDSLLVIHDAIKEIEEDRVPMSDLVMLRKVGTYKESSNYYIKPFVERLNKAGRKIEPEDRLEYVVVKDPVETKVGYCCRLPDELAVSNESIDVDYYVGILIKSLEGDARLKDGLLFAVYRNKIEEYLGVSLKCDRKIYDAGKSPCTYIWINFIHQEAIHDGNFRDVLLNLFA